MTASKTLRRFASVAAFCALFLAATASLASAAPAWKVVSTHGPQNFAPGQSGQYVIQAFNIGDTATSGACPGANCVTISNTLPAGVKAISASGSGWSSCKGFGVLGGAVTCTRTGAVQPLGGLTGTDADVRGAAQPLVITVSVDPGAAPGTSDNAVTISGGGALAPASDLDPTNFSLTPAGFGLAAGSFQADVFDAESPAGAPVRQAGSHLFELRVDFDQNLALGSDPDTAQPLFTLPDETIKSLQTRLPAGMIGNPQATPRCPQIRLNRPGPASKGYCPANTQVGTIDLTVNNGKALVLPNATTDVPVYNMEPPPGTVAAFAFSIVGNTVWIHASLDPQDNYSVVTTLKDIIDVLPTRSARLTMWGVPGDPAHDALRMNPEATGATAMGTPFAGAPVKPFLALPTGCDAGGSIQQREESWQNPGVFTPWESGADIQATGCEDPRIRFEPRISIQPTSHEAASPTGLDIDLDVPQKDDTVSNAGDLYSQSGKDQAIVTPHLKDAVTKLPVGMTVNPSVADGLVGCSVADIGLDDNDAPNCPDNSKIGTVAIESSLVPDTLKGSIYQAKQSQNPHGSLLGFYTVAQGSGLTIKLAAKVVADPDTGQLSTIFLDNPQLPFDHYKLSFFGGQRAPLVNPPTCGTHTSTAHFTAWNSSVEPVDTGDSFQLTSGPNGKPCVGSLAERPFAPGFDAKSLLPIAGAFSEFALDVSREDGTQELRTIETTLPRGVLAKLAGVPYCSEAAIAGISSAPGTGLGERLSPSCPAASLIGHSDAAAGAGALPFHNPGNVYLAGPYKGAPLSLAVVTPVVAGPLDLGSIVVRAAMYVDPATAQVRVVSDPIPEKIVADGNGFPLNVRSVRVAIDRDGFTLNPTSCDPMSVDGAIGSLQGASAAVSERFQVGACAALGFKPSLGLRLIGKTNRGAHPKLRAVLKMPEGDSNIARAVVALPRSVFLDQAHIGTVCTRVQYAAEQCPAAAVYGYARAFSPLLDEPLRGPVYLRSSDNELPDLVASLDGQIHVDLAGRIDSVRGGIRSSFDLVPDAPVSKFVLTMKGGKKGLLQNSRNLCQRVFRASANFDSHSGKIADLRPRLRAACKKRLDS